MGLPKERFDYVDSIVTKYMEGNKVAAVATTAQNNVNHEILLCPAYIPGAVWKKIEFCNEVKLNQFIEEDRVR